MGQIADVLKYEGDNTTFVWKHPLEDFNSMTQLLVHETQEAIFFMNGQALDLFEKGRYTLETQNIPKLSKLLNRVTGDQNPFHCEVYFINKTEQMPIKWGTDSKFQYKEPSHGFPLYLGARGEMSLRVDDSRKLLLKLVGTENYLSQARLVDYFRAVLMTKVKSYMAQTLRAKAISIFEIDEHLNDFSNDIHNMLLPDFEDYGIKLEKFFVTSVLKPDGDPQYEKCKELYFKQFAEIAEASIKKEVGIIEAQTEAQKTVIISQGLATKRAQEGTSVIIDRGFDVLEKLAENEGSAFDIRNGIGGVMGNTFNGIVGGTMNSFMEATGAAAVNPREESAIPGMINLKEDIPVEENNLDDDMIQFKKKLDMLTMTKDAGLLSDEEFQQKKMQLLEML